MVAMASTRASVPTNLKFIFINMAGWTALICLIPLNQPPAPLLKSTGSDNVSEAVGNIK